MRECTTCVPAEREPQAIMVTTFLPTGLFNVHTLRKAHRLGAAKLHIALMQHAFSVAFGPFKRSSRKRSFLRIFPDKNFSTNSIAQYAMLYMRQGPFITDK